MTWQYSHCTRVAPAWRSLFCFSIYTWHIYDSDNMHIHSHTLQTHQKILPDGLCVVTKAVIEYVWHLSGGNLTNGFLCLCIYVTYEWHDNMHAYVRTHSHPYQNIMPDISCVVVKATTCVASWRRWHSLSKYVWHCNTYAYIYTHMQTCENVVHTGSCVVFKGVATSSRPLQIIGLFCKRAL